MDISSLKILKAQKKAINRAILLPLIILLMVMGYLIVTNYLDDRQLAWNWLSIYLLPLIFMIIFDALLIMTIRKKTNVYQVAANLSAEELAHIDSQLDNKISLFKTPLIYTDRMLFVASGLSVQAVPLEDVVWLKHQTTTGAIEVVTRQKKTLKVHSQFMPNFFQQLVDKIQVYRPHLLVSNNQTDGEGKALADLFKKDFNEMVRKSDHG
jgi:hypothetical protein